MNEKIKLRMKYWAVLMNPMFVLLYVIGFRNLYLLCQFGGVRRRLPLIVACGFLGLIWIIAWTIIYFVRKRHQKEKASVRKKIYVILLWVGILALTITTIYYGGKIIHSAINYNGKLSWKLDEIKSSRQITLEHDNLYRDSVNGIFEDLKEKLQLPSDLYIVNQFVLEFDKEGTITDIYTFFYGKDAKGEEHTYLLTYDKSESDKMTVWLDGYADCDYASTMKMEQMFELLNMVNIQQQTQEWQDQNEVDHFGILYKGYRSFYNAEGIVSVNEDGSSSAFYNSSGVPEEIAGYEVSLYVPENDSIIPVRYMNMWDKVDTEESGVNEQEGNSYEIGTCFTDSYDGTLYFFIDQSKGWRLMITDAALGSRYYEMESTDNGGSTWNKINIDPFAGNIGVAEGIVFFDKNFGYIGMGTATEEYSKLYVTKDGGNNFTEVKLPIQEVGDEVTNIEDYDYAYMPYVKDSVIQIVLGKEKAGQEKGLLFQSEDKGESWKYLGLIDT